MACLGVPCNFIESWKSRQCLVPLLARQPGEVGAGRRGRICDQVSMNCGRAQILNVGVPAFVVEAPKRAVVFINLLSLLVSHATQAMWWVTA